MAQHESKYCDLDCVSARAIPKATCTLEKLDSEILACSDSERRNIYLIFNGGVGFTGKKDTTNT